MKTVSFYFVGFHEERAVLVFFFIFARYLYLQSHRHARLLVAVTASSPSRSCSAVLLHCVVFGNAIFTADRSHGICPQERSRENSRLVADIFTRDFLRETLLCVVQWVVQSHRFVYSMYCDARKNIEKVFSHVSEISKQSI